MARVSRRDLESWLEERGLLVGDGAMGTQLQAAGLPPGGCPERWNTERPEAVEAILRAYREAGAELLETNTFGGSPAKLAAYGLAAACEALNHAGARLGRRAAGDDALVVGSIGPTGQLLAPLGPLSAEEAAEGFRRQAEALAEGGADALCVETMTDLEEAVVAVRAAAATGLPVLATMTFEATPRGFYTIMGVSVAAAARALAAAGACALGANCGFGPEAMVPILAAFARETPLPLVAQPNAGLPETAGDQLRWPATPDAMAAWVPALVGAGGRILGGCCGTTPAHVRALAEAVRRHARAPRREGA
jgi:5-methyltetrahydrofolate--homocysteine methyltransferase